MDQALFNVISGLEMQAEKERLQTGKTTIPDPDAAKLLSILAVSNKANMIVEVGSGVGYTTLWLAYAASLTGGRVITCELDPAKAATVRTNLEKGGLAERVEILTGDAREVLRHRDEPVDFLFIDGQNSQYETYFDVVYKQMSVGATVVAGGVVTDEDELADYVTYVQNHPSLESITVPVGDGLEVSVKTAA
jgi:predicted O-methyltransferase YrrM